MTGAGSGGEAVRDAVRWCLRLAEVLVDAGHRVRQLGEQLPHDWPDAHGREWAERVVRLGSALGRDALEATELGQVYARRGSIAESAVEAPPLGVPGSTGRRRGVRLGGTDAVRVADERGVRIAELPADPPQPPG